MKLKHLASTIIATSMAASPAFAAKKINACVFDIAGKTGPAYEVMKDYKLEATKWGVDLNLKVEQDEGKAEAAFKVGKCDLVAITGIRARQYNKFAYSINAIGAVTNYKDAKKLLGLAAKPALSKYLTSNLNGTKYEVAGITTLGSAYLFVRDRSINTMKKAKGKKFAVLSSDKTQAKLVKANGLQAVSSDITTFAGKFNNGSVDIVAAPALAYDLLELQKGLGTKGGVVDFPLTQVTGVIVIRKDKFPAGFGQKSRKFVAKQAGKAIKQARDAEKTIPKKYWIKLNAADKQEYSENMRKARIGLKKDGAYDPKMLKLIKKVRCGSNPSLSECSQKGE